ncbi:hypothetical protein CWB41_15885 [Methylovirgula ligni]|uniref:Uncharacterized protein n=1 Tax=Methylovirgula ligni TaxID=569860 RepID=A0A3D9Z1C5_9HYPH|nr:hypothetical protein [Methylovirgula ligni]QAY97033.1 hypothetical protein CWB41_15885 [Methylovirgula ligni]REF87898.1 hypothetical protein DES32_1535 [Methylovirgula ligni]
MDYLDIDPNSIPPEGRTLTGPEYCRMYREIAKDDHLKQVAEWIGMYGQDAVLHLVGMALVKASDDIVSDFPDSSSDEMSERYMADAYRVMRLADELADEVASRLDRRKA